uniref:uncharacterized protein LOC120337136 n=1 Tax=Styela clava TaxID=7725 RepID=UPI001939AC25|nr:uncharacterized protein LOC120337136 [Styela clava]
MQNLELEFNKAYSFILLPKKSLYTHECRSTQIGSNCLLKYKTRWIDSNQILVHVIKFNKDKDCPSPRSTITVALPIVISILCVGIVSIIIWKYYQTWRDKRLYEYLQKRKSGNLAMNLSSMYKDKKRKSSGYSNELNNKNLDVMDDSCSRLDDVFEDDAL